MHQKEKVSASCKKCRGVLFDFVSELTSEETSAWVKDHIRHCPSCQKEYDSICRMLASIQNIPTPELPQGFQAKLHQNLVKAATEMQEKKKHSFLEQIKRMRNSMTWKTLAPALGCLALLLGVYGVNSHFRWKIQDDILSAGEVQTPSPTTVLQDEKIEAEPVYPNTKTQTAQPVESEVPNARISSGTEEEQSNVPIIEPQAEHTPMPACELSENEPASSDPEGNWRLVIEQTVEQFLEEAKTETETDWRSKATVLEERKAVLVLSRAEWEVFSQYIQTKELHLQAINSEPGGETITVEIQEDGE